MLKSLIDDMADQLVSGIAAGASSTPRRCARRWIPPRQRRRTRRKSASSTRSTTATRRSTNCRTRPIPTTRFRRAASSTITRPRPAKTKIALIYTVGELSREANDNPLSDDTTSDPREVLAAFRQASDDPDIKAIVFRINSRAAQSSLRRTIRNGVLLARDADKPVIVSMGEMAGSGGYLDRADADKIIAEPATLTGSIGVLAAKPVVQKLLADHNINTDYIANGRTR